MAVDRWPVDFRYISSRLVRQIVQQDEATRRRWRFRFDFPTPVARVSIEREPLDRENEFVLCRKATVAVREQTSTLAQGYGPYIRAELDLTMGLVTPLMGWEGRDRVEIAAMRAEADDDEYGRVLVTLFGSASNYMGRKPVSDELAEIPSDVDGLYGILERTREPGDPLIENWRLDDDFGNSPTSRAEAAMRTVGERFKGFREEHLDVLMVYFCGGGAVGPYGRVIVGAPIWVATPEPRSLDELGR